MSERTTVDNWKDSEEQIQLLLRAVEDTEDSVLITDADLESPGPRIVFVNPGFSKMTGYSRDEVLGRSPRILQGPKTERKVLDELRRCLEKGEPFFGETINYRKDGSEYFLEWHISPVRDTAGRITHFVSVQRDITARKKAEELQVQFHQQKARTAAIVETQEEERRRIAKELHDALGQMLVAAKFNMDVLQDKLTSTDDDVKKRVAGIKDMLNQIMIEVRKISYDLMPGILEDFGLSPALGYLCDQLSQTGGLKVQFITAGMNERLPRQVEVGLYRIAQESLNNVVKHAQAREATVQLIKNERTITLSIEDDGRGFEAETDRSDPMSGGMGLMNMRERADAIRASFFIHSKKDHGTEIMVQWEESL